MEWNILEIRLMCFRTVLVDVRREDYSVSGICKAQRYSPSTGKKIHCCRSLPLDGQPRQKRVVVGVLAHVASKVGSTRIDCDKFSCCVPVKRSVPRSSVNSFE